MQVSLEEYLSQEIEKPFSYELKTDCVGTVLRWIEINRGYSFYDRFDLDYSTVDEKDGILTRNVNFWQAILKYAKLNGERVTKHPKKGDVAVIVVSNTQIGLAIHCGSFWFTRHVDGVIGRPIKGTKVLRAWKIKND